MSLWAPGPQSFPGARMSGTPFLTVVEVARLIRRSASYVYQENTLASAGGARDPIPVRYPDGKPSYLRDEVVAWWTARCTRREDAARPPASRSRILEVHARLRSLKT